MEICIEGISEEKPTKVSFGEIYSDSSLDRRMIAIEGRFSYGFEDVALYPFNNSDHSKKGLWINFNQKIFENDSLLMKLNGKEVTITGTLNFSKKGHLGYYYGTIENVTCIRQVK